MSLSKVLHGIQSGNNGDLDTARSLYMKNSCVRARPLTFFVRQGKVPPDNLENLAGSHDCFTGNNLCEVAMQEKYFKKGPKRPRH